MVEPIFKRSEQGAEAAWKGFTSQSLYIRFRIVCAEGDCDYYPEKLEDLMLKKDNQVFEVVQIKDYSSKLTISDLDASTKSEGLFRRALSLKNENPNLIIKVVHFGELGAELSSIAESDKAVIATVTEKLCKKYGLTINDAQWILSCLKFEKVTHEALESIATVKVAEYVPTMIAPGLAKDLLTYYVFKLSQIKGKTSKKDWRDTVAQIGNDMAASDGYFREYGGSLIRLADIPCQEDRDKLEAEFRQGVSTCPAHILNGLDLARNSWLDKIKTHFTRNNIVIVKGASGQGKTALSYRYLYDEYSPENVFCIRAIKDQAQAENLVKAIVGLSKHYAEKLIVYIDVNPGETHWTWMLREVKVRSVEIKILVSIRHEDYKLANIDASLVSPEIIELQLWKEEASGLYDVITAVEPHPLFRSFEDAWQAFGEAGPLLEFMFLLKNNETLKQRLEAQVEKLKRDAGTESDQWLDLLRIVCFASKTGCPSLVAEIKKSRICKNFVTAIGRMAEEYLIRNTSDGRYLESLHPIRAKILYDILKDDILYPEHELLLSCLSCSEQHFVKILLLNHFLGHHPNDDLISQIAQVKYRDWEAYAGALDAMLWLDIRGYIEKNAKAFDFLIQEKRNEWRVFAPLDISGMTRTNETLAEKLGNIKPELLEDALKNKALFVSLSLEYHYCDRWFQSASIPTTVPTYDVEWMYLGYSLFWMSNRGKYINEFSNMENFSSAMKVGAIEYKAAALQGLYNQRFFDIHKECSEILVNRIIRDYKVVYFSRDDNCVSCKFIPPLLADMQDKEGQNNFNHYWTMKMVDILSRIYPTNPYIEVSLVGIDLLTELGISAIDNVKKIPLENRPDTWFTRINATYKNLLEYNHRPKDWIEYIGRVNDVRKEISNIFTELIQTIDSLYKKGYVKGTKVFDEVENFSHKLSNHKPLLPQICVDEFGVYSEGRNQDTMLKAAVSLSVYETNDLRGSICDTISCVQNYINQYGTILIARKESKEIPDHLSEHNLYSAAQSMGIMQLEFRTLFANYLPQGYDAFEIQEKDAYLTLLGVWNEVLRTPIRKIGILSYDVKVKNKRISATLLASLQRFIDSRKHPVKLVKSGEGSEDVYYFVYECNVEEGSPVQDHYVKICLALRKVFREAEINNCFRWYLETHWPKMVFVPSFNGCYICAFAMPIYKLLDMPDAEISNVLLPAVIDDEIYKTMLGETEKSLLSRRCIGEIGKIRLLLLHYNQVISIIHDDQDNMKNEGIVSWFIDFCERFNIDDNLIGQFFACFHSSAEAIDDDTLFLLQTLTECIKNLSCIPDRLQKLEPVNDILEQLQNAMNCMLLLSAR